MTGKKHHHKKCLQIFKRLSEYLDKELEARIGQEISLHLQECIRCQVCLETLKRTIELMQKCQTEKHPITSPIRH